MARKITMNGQSRKSVAGATRYEISSIEDEGKQYVVYGNGGFYDKYGNVCKPYSDDSGSYSFTFEVKTNKATGRVSYCKIM